MMRNVIAVGIGTACALASAAATHPALQALSKSEPIPTAGANPISLRAWRLTGTNVEMKVVDSFEGRKYPVRLAYSAQAGCGEKQNGWVNFCEYNILRPFQEWIPPYIGIKARRVAMEVWPQTAEGKARVTFRVRQARCMVEGENFVETNDITPRTTSKKTQETELIIKPKKFTPRYKAMI